MSKFGITPEGYKRKTYQDLIEEIEKRLKQEDYFGENIDFSNQDPLKHFTAPIMYIISDLWEILEQNFYNASPAYAEGNQLSDKGMYIGISRKQPSKAEGAVTFIGEKGSVIYKGFKVATKSGIVFETTREGIIPESGFITLDVVAMTAGASGNTPAGTITLIVNPIIGLTSVTNEKDTIKGQDKESDTEFRERYKASVSIRNTNVYDSILSNVLRVTGVSSADIKENDQTIEIEGIPPKSFRVLVVGGDDEEVARAIFYKKPAGIQAYGKKYISISDNIGRTHEIGITRPEYIKINAKITIKTNKDYPIQGNKIIESLVSNAINEFGLGKNVTLFKLFSIIGSANVDGIEDIKIEIGKAGEPLTEKNIVIGEEDVAISNDIEVIDNAE
ncbi:TPA: baseplate J/gp47 family protein [Clostridium botulinum]|uniref:baseplate J/gp47 family protein n=1 Tax=Clostridium botulinum TaxID=1491 RepID=UPI000518C384|nr:baseplate J/gp47 family protein [Clostridium botulinum]APC82199.1 baseplate J-like family protein [Clostridium botulinum]HBJ1682476.1 baseplate J/gp47 family protein [Clostridium botulinum]HBJ1686083.1 baseplate J/gp47 family protein [Clostridium botulinum]HBJ2607743.1 baseplate J/gp47 family protein [Clostridium botulinum]HDI3019096.1 baseplate J/gp47 family protein [Clostridium botulinum]